MGIFKFSKSIKPIRIEVNDSKRNPERIEYFNGFRVYSGPFLQNHVIVKDISQISIVAKFMNEKGYDSLALADRETKENISCLSSFKSLKRLILPIANKDLDLAPIEYLHQLEDLRLQWNYKTPPDFNKLKQLKRLSFQYTNKQWDSGFSVENLYKLHLQYFKAVDLESLSGLRNLKELTLLNCTAHSFQGIQQLSNLKRLSCAYFKNVTHIESLPISISELILANFPNLENVNFVKKLVHLTDFEIDNCKEIESLAPTSELRNLKRMRLIGNTKLKDGDYSLERNNKEE